MKEELTPENFQNVMSESQVFQVQQQILAYKMMIRGMNVPRDLEKNLFTLSKEQWDVEKDRLAQRSIKYYNENLEKNDELKKLLSRYNSSKKTNPPPATQPATDPNAPQQPQNPFEAYNDPAAGQYVE